MMGHMSPAGLKIMMVFFTFMAIILILRSVQPTWILWARLSVYIIVVLLLLKQSIKVHLNYLYLEKLWIDCLIYLLIMYIIYWCHWWFTRFIVFSLMFRSIIKPLYIYIIKKRLNLDEVLEMNLYISLIRVFGIYIFRLSLLKFTIYIYIYKHSHF